MLGSEVCTALQRRRHEVVAAGLRRGQVLQDLADVDGTLQMVDAVRPDVVIHCAAFTDVDAAEANPDEAFRTNARGAWSIAIACARTNVPLCAISTDFVFDGLKGSPYTEWDEPRPTNVYGASKLAGERAIREVCPRHWIVRTAWLYGLNGRCFPSAILTAARHNTSLRVVADQTGSPTYARDLAAAIAALIETGRYGTYHLANAGQATRYELARAVLQMAGLQHVELHPIPSCDWPTPAKRPRNSALCSALGPIPGYGTMRPWPAALAEYIQDFITTTRRGDPTCS